MGHRPCFECRRKDAEAFAEKWREARRLSSPPYAAETDKVLHAERLRGRARRLHRRDIDDLPDGEFTALGGAAFAIRGDTLTALDARRSWCSRASRRVHHQRQIRDFPRGPRTIACAHPARKPIRGRVVPGQGVRCGHSHARWFPNIFVAVVCGRLYDRSCRRQESAKCQNKQCARRQNVW